MYWVCRTRVYVYDGAVVTAKLIRPTTRAMIQRYGTLDLHTLHEQGVSRDDLTFTYQVNPRHPYPDNYSEGAGFNLYSLRLVQIMQQFDVKHALFDAKLVDAKGQQVNQAPYFVFVLGEPLMDAMDAEQSKWHGDREEGIPKLVLDERKFEHRPMFTCRDIHVLLVRDDLREAMRDAGITGFGFLAPARYRSGSYGFPPDYED